MHLYNMIKHDVTVDGFFWGGHGLSTVNWAKTIKDLKSWILGSEGNLYCVLLCLVFCALFK